MPVLADNAAVELVQLLELEGFTRWRDRADVIVLVNASVTPHPIPVRLNSPLTDEVASGLLRTAGISERRISQFIANFAKPASEEEEQEAPSKWP